jgi:hypothetical protein
MSRRKLMINGGNLFHPQKSPRHKHSHLNFGASKQICEKKFSGLLKKQAPSVKACFSDLQLYNICCLRALIALNDIKAHIIAFGQAFETIATNLGIVCKNIGTIILGDESETL